MRGRVGTRPPLLSCRGRWPSVYDLMLLIDATAPEDRRSAIVARGGGDALLAAAAWSARTTGAAGGSPSRSITARRPRYHLFQFEGDNALLDRLNHSLKIMEGVLRFRIIRQRPGCARRPTQPGAAPRAARRGARRARGRPRRRRRATRARRRSRGARSGSRRRLRRVKRTGARRDPTGRLLASLPPPAQTLLRLAFVAARITSGPRSFATYVRLSRIRRHVGSAGRVVRLRLRPLGGRAGARQAEHV